MLGIAYNKNLIIRLEQQKDPSPTIFIQAPLADHHHQFFILVHCFTDDHFYYKSLKTPERSQRPRDHRLCSNIIKNRIESSSLTRTISEPVLWTNCPSPYLILKDDPSLFNKLTAANTKTE